MGIQGRLKKKKHRCRNVFIDVKNVTVSGVAIIKIHIYNSVAIFHLYITSGIN